MKRICPRCGTVTFDVNCPNDGFRTIDAAFFEPESEDRDPLVGTFFCRRYHIESLIARGNSGRVYQADQLKLGRTVAIQVLNPRHIDSWDAVTRFQLEARTIANLRHPNTVRLYDFGISDGRFFLVMEFIDGESLGTLVHRHGCFDSERTIGFAKQILGALAEAHQHGIVHRDLKPANVLISQVGLRNDVVKLLDFGIAKWHSLPENTEAGHPVHPVIGTPGYMAPEQILGQPISPRTDIYAVGALAYEMLTGRSAFDTADPLSCVTEHLGTPVPVLHRDGATLEGPLVDFVMWCLAKRPDDRPQTAAEAMFELEVCQGQPLRKKRKRRLVAPTPMMTPAVTPAVDPDAPVASAEELLEMPEKAPTADAEPDRQKVATRQFTVVAPEALEPSGTAELVQRQKSESRAGVFMLFAVVATVALAMYFMGRERPSAGTDGDELSSSATQVSVTAPARVVGVTPRATELRVTEGKNLRGAAGRRRATRGYPTARAIHDAVGRGLWCRALEQRWDRSGGRGAGRGRRARGACPSRRSQRGDRGSGDRAGRDAEGRQGQGRRRAGGGR